MARRLRKASTKLVHKGKNLEVVRWTHPPNSTTGRHIEARPYLVVPLTPGKLQRQIYRTARGQSDVVKSTAQLKPFVAYERKTGRGVDHELINKGKKTIVSLKIYVR